MAKDKPFYPHAPISTLDVLAKSLGVSPQVMSKLSSSADDSYTAFSVSSKNKDRTVYDPKYNLKKLQKRINSRIFEHVVFPQYLHGGIRDVSHSRDYINNSRIHAGSRVLVSLDIKNFYDNIKRDSVFDIFKSFFRFPDEVSTLLTNVVTMRGKVPQGGCTSSYVANLIFHNTEYSVVSYLRSFGIEYSRLLDDVTLSSSHPIPPEKLEQAISKVAGMFKRHGLRVHPHKKKIESSSDSRSPYEVTGVWVGHGVPKIRRKDRDYARQLVYICTKEYLKDYTSDAYHALWNKSSAHVARMTRLDHAQARQLRDRLSKILPQYSAARIKQLSFEYKKLINRPVADVATLGFSKSFHKLIHSIGILSRTDAHLARHYRKSLRAKFPRVLSKADHWGI
ncbi:reverse transcriptase family protein [Phytopseudomonas punonensis]|uniref:RNA-directed DNA polymerase n=1 Tax=Phytopseudomonas punonensis TaxID=1220495 RepID=A0A1M7NRD9_9GAMM|nr:reverse transcriptase family protein [Pseudomonas punonensis]SHN06634.1 Reverse transcriptase (RNA-dependent DNA polymerase) [Pseudomonas punonensis]